MIGFNPWFGVGAIALCIACYAAGRHDGSRLEESAQAREERAAQVAYDNAQRAAAEAIAKLEVKHVTYKQQIEREVREVPVYRDCRNTPGGMLAINAALANGAVASGGSELPANTRNADRRLVRSDSSETGGGIRGVLQVSGSGLGWQ